MQESANESQSINEFLEHKMPVSKVKRVKYVGRLYRIDFHWKSDPSI